MRMSPNGLDILKQFEGCRLEAYLDSVGVPTIGHGHTLGVKLGDVITQDEADRLLREDDLPQYEKAVSDAVMGPIGTVPTPTINQFDAMVCLCYNIGVSAFMKSSVARRFRQENIRGAADGFLMWNKGRIDGILVVLPGLDRRRKAERRLFLTGEQS